MKPEAPYRSGSPDSNTKSPEKLDNYNQLAYTNHSKRYLPYVKYKERDPSWKIVLVTSQYFIL